MRADPDGEKVGGGACREGGGEAIEQVGNPQLPTPSAT